MKNYLNFKIYFVFLITPLSLNATKTTLNDHEPIHVFAALDFPIEHATDHFTVKIMREIESTFGQSGMKLDGLQIKHIKNSYLYLIFLTKLQKVKTNSLYQTYKSDFASFLKDNGLKTPHLPTQALLTSPGWQKVEISSKDIVQSPMWQHYCKSMISDTIAYFATGLKIIHNVEKQEFNYIPHFETSYYNQDYTALRTINSIARTKIALEHGVKNRLLSDSVGWKNLPAQPSSGAISTVPTLEQAIVDFRGTPFYIKTHDPHALLGTRETVNAGQTITREQLLSSPGLTSPLKEHVFGYFMLYEMYGQLTANMTADNLEDVLSAGETSKLIPNIFPYRDSDFVLLDELLAAKSKAEGTHLSSIHPSPKTFKPEDFRNPADMVNPTRASTDQYVAGRTGQPIPTTTPTHSVVAQKVTKPSVQAQNFFDNIGDDIKHDEKKAWTDIKSGAEAAWKGTKDFGEAIGYGAAGLGCEAVFWDQSVVAEGEHFNQESAHNFKAAATQLQASISDFASSIKDGIIAPIGELSGDLVGFITQDKALGLGVSQAIDSTADAIVSAVADVAGDTAGGLLLATAQITLDAAQAAEDITTLIVTGAEAIFTGKTNDFLNAWHTTLHNCLTDLTTAYTEGKQIGEALVASVMQAIGAIVNVFTTIFIDLSREITFVFVSFGELIATGSLATADARATATANHVNGVLNANRSTINQVMGVVICVVADVALDAGTAGAGTAADAEMDAMIMGAADGSEDIGVEAAQAAETGAQEAVSAAQDAVDQAVADGDEVAEAAARQLLEKQEALEKEAIENVAKAQAKAALKKMTTAGAKAEEKTLAERAVGAAKEKLENALEDLKNIPKSLKNIARSAKDLAKEAAEDLKTKEDDLVKAEEKFAKAKEAYLDDPEDPEAKENFDKEIKNTKEAKANLKEAKDLAKETETRLGESAGGKALRYVKNAFKIFKPMGLIMNLTFNLTTIIGGYNQNEQNLLQQQQQESTLKNLWQANIQSKLSLAQTDLAYLEEIKLKQTAAAGNMIIGLALYQNSNYAYINTYQQNILAALAPMYVGQLYPNLTTNLMAGNTGSLWGLTSNYLDLYPSQGFYSVTTGRPDFPFAQEIAQVPLTSISQSTTPQEKQWFNQRCMAVDRYTKDKVAKQPLDPLSVEIEFKFLYTLDSGFHVGIYMGGNYHDYFSKTYLADLLNTSVANIASAHASLIADIRANQKITPPVALVTNYLNPKMIDLNEPYLAKMLILYRNSGTDSLKLGLYEHLGAQPWLLQQVLPLSAQLDRDHSYRLQATLSGDSINIALFVDGSNTAIARQTIAVTPLANQRMYGVVCSGVAAEWNQISPTPELTVHKSVRPTLTIIPEIERAKKMKFEFESAQNPVFGTIPLTPISKQAIMFHQFIYGSSKTDLVKMDPAHAADFLVFATNTSGEISNIGKAPNTKIDSATNVLVSLITGHVFNAAGDVIKIVPGVWKLYKTTVSGQFITNLDGYIKAEQTRLNSAMSKIKFGPFGLNIMSPNSLSAGAYIYQCAQTLKNSSGQPAIDYVVFTAAPSTNPSALTLGIPPTNADAMISLVTGNLYLKSTQFVSPAIPTPVYTYPAAALLHCYASSDNITTNDYSTIYAAIVQQASQPQPAAPQPHSSATNKATAAMIAKKTVAPVGIPATANKYGFTPPYELAKRRAQAAGNAKYQMPTAKG